MADIAMCNMNDCPIKNKCHRHTAPVNPHWQSYLVPEVVGKECNFFWDNKGYKGERK